MTFIPDDTAICAQVDAELWFPTRALDGTPGTTKQAVALCHTCPLIDPCRDYAISNAVEGVWGGTTDRQREKMRHKAGTRATPLLGWSQTPERHPPPHHPGRRMTLFDDAWLAQFGPIRDVQPWTYDEVTRHLRDMLYELATLPVSIDTLMADAANLPHPDRRYRLQTKDSRLLALIAVRRSAAAWKQQKDKQAEAFRWMHTRGWRADDICKRLGINTSEYDQLLRQVA